MGAGKSRWYDDLPQKLQQYYTGRASVRTEVMLLAEVRDRLIILPLPIPLLDLIRTYYGPLIRDGCDVYQYLTAKGKHRLQTLPWVLYQPLLAPYVGRPEYVDRLTTIFQAIGKEDLPQDIPYYVLYQTKPATASATELRRRYLIDVMGHPALVFGFHPRERMRIDRESWAICYRCGSDRLTSWDEHKDKTESDSDHRDCYFRDWSFHVVCEQCNYRHSWSEREQLAEAPGQDSRQLTLW